MVLLCFNYINKYIYIHTYKYLIKKKRKWERLKQDWKGRGWEEQLSQIISTKSQMKRSTHKRRPHCALSPFSSTRRTNTHTHIYIYIHICIYLKKNIVRQTSPSTPSPFSLFSLSLSEISFLMIICMLTSIICQMKALCRLQTH